MVSSDVDKQFASDLQMALVRLIKKLRKKSPSGLKLSLTERSTLSLLNQHKNLLPGELAAMEMITNQSMSQVLNHLFELGFINRNVSDADRRKVNISLSKDGEKMLAQFRQERDEWLLRAINANCTPAEKKLLQLAINPLMKLADFE